jgi:hypothetical protein
MVDVERGAESRTADVTFALTRHASDLEPNLGGEARIAAGKGALNCRSPQTIYVWSMGMAMAKEGELFPSQQSWPSCPRPSGWRILEDVVVACSRS